jgi:hypothetical protein
VSIVEQGGRAPVFSLFFRENTGKNRIEAILGTENHTTIKVLRLSSGRLQDALAAEF